MNTLQKNKNWVHFMVPWNVQEPESCQLQRASTLTPTRSSALRPRWERLRL